MNRKVSSRQTSATHGNDILHAIAFLNPSTAIGISILALLSAIALLRLGDSCKSSGDDLQKLAIICTWWGAYAFVACLLLRERITNQAVSIWLRLRQQPGKLLGASVFVMCLCYSSLVNGAVANGDAALYNTRIELGLLGEGAIHWGYYIFGTVFAKWVPIDLDLAMNIACAGSGVLGIALLYLIVWWCCADALLAFLTSVAVGLSANYVYSAIYSEVYIVQVAAVLVSFALWNRGRSFCAGLSLAFAMTVSILSVVVVPLFLLVPVKRHRLLVLAVATALAYALFLAFYWESLLFGDRGLLTGAGTKYSTSGLASGWAASAKILVGSFPILLPWLLASMFIFIRQQGCKKALWIWLSLLTVAAHALTAGKFDEWGFDIVIYPLICAPLLALLTRFRQTRLPGSKQAGRIIMLVGLAVLFNISCSLSLWVPTHFRLPCQLRELFQEINRRYGPDARPLGQHLHSVQGMYARANGHPYQRPVPWFLPDKERDYIVLDQMTLDSLYRQGLDPHAAEQVNLLGHRVWHVRYTPPHQKKP